jgi:hypothetical protein
MGEGSGMTQIVLEALVTFGFVWLLVVFWP